MLRLKRKALVKKNEEAAKKAREDDSSSSDFSDDSDDIQVIGVQQPKPDKNAAAWHDTDDSDEDDEDNKRKRFEKEFGPIPSHLCPSEGADRRSEACSDSDSDSEKDNDAEGGHLSSLSQRAGPLLARSAALPVDALLYKRVRDANADQPAKATVTSVRFHPWSPVVMVGSTDRSINLFHVDGDSNEKLASHYFDLFPIKCARFTPDGKRVVAAGIRKSFRVLDLDSEQVLAVRSMRGVDHPIQQFEISPDGRYIVFIGMWGALHVVDSASLEKVATLEANGRIMSLAFASEAYLYAFGDDGKVYRFSMAALHLEGSFIDDGCVGGRAVAVSGDDGLLACGHSTGVVNLYRHADTFLRPPPGLSTAAPRPIKTANNLLTACDNLRFGPAGELLLMASSHDPGAIKGLHTASGRVFANFPGRADRFAKVTDLDVSPNGAYAALGQSNGRAALLRLLHYERY